ncbi:MAG: hypothetical protein G01um101431_1016, partial [Parcubacteria group bacterium Gr01-1014_31]
TPTPAPAATPTPTPTPGGGAAGPPTPLPPQQHPDPYVPNEGTVAPYVYVGMLDGTAIAPGDVGTTYAFNPLVTGLRLPPPGHHRGVPDQPDLARQRGVLVPGGADTGNTSAVAHARTHGNSSANAFRCAVADRLPIPFTIAKSGTNRTAVSGPAAGLA